MLGEEFQWSGRDEKLSAVGFKIDGRRETKDSEHYQLFQEVFVGICDEKKRKAVGPGESSGSQAKF